MRMKAVCEATGLTDRAVRYYISEGLIDPDYTENYTGRRTYDFSEADIRQLQDITVLRKFEFTVAEIRSMLQDPSQIEPTVAALRERKRLEISEEQALLDALERLTDPCANVSELALALCTPAQTALVPAEDSAVAIEDICWNYIVTIFRTIVAWGPLAASAAVYVQIQARWEYPVPRPELYPYLLLSLLPSLVILNWSRLRERFGWKKEIGCLMWSLCLLSIPFAAFFSLSFGTYSETTDIRNYRYFDSDCIINRSAFFDEFFPTWPHYFDHVYNEEGELEQVDLDAKYLYRYTDSWDYTYDVYAEWPYLTREEYDREVARVTALFESTDRAQQEPDEDSGYVKLQKGNWTCLVLYSWQEPFVTVESSYYYSIFAYDPDALRVRYIYCDSMDDGYDQPYYLQLDWE